MSKRPTNAALIAQGRLAERADVIEQIRQSMAGAQAIAARSGASDADTDLLVARLDALAGTIEAGCHEGLAQ